MMVQLTPKKTRPLFTGVYLVLLLAGTANSGQILFKADQNSTDVSAFKFYDAEFAGRADYAAMTLDATGTGGKSFVKIYAETDVKFNVSIYIPGREGIDRITAAAVERHGNEDPVFTPVSWDYVVDEGMTLILNAFNVLQVWEGEALLITSTGDLTNLYIHQPEELRDPDQPQTVLYCIQGNEEITAGPDTSGNRGLMIESIATPSMWGRQFIVPQLVSGMRGHSVKVMAWLPHVRFSVRKSGGVKEDYQFENFEPMEFHLSAAETMMIWSSDALCVMQYTWGGIGNNFAPAAMTVFDWRLGYTQHKFTIDSADYLVYTSVGCKKDYLTEIYDYSLGMFLSDATSTKLEVEMPDGNTWATCVNGPYSQNTKEVDIQATGIVTEIIDGVPTQMLPSFVVSVYAVCRRSICTGATAADITLQNGVMGVGVASDDVMYREEALKETTAPPDVSTTVVPSTDAPSTAASTAPSTVPGTQTEPSDAPTSGMPTSEVPTTQPDPANIPEDDCPCVKVSGVPPGNNRDNLQGFMLRSLAPPALDDATVQHETAAEVTIHAKRQVYQHENCGLYLYFHSQPANYWLFGPEVGGSRGWLLNHDLNLDISGISEPWRELSMATNGWQDVAGVNVECACKDYPCAALQLTTDAQFGFDGVFFIHGMANHRAVYKHSTQDLYLSYFDDDKACQTNQNEGSFWVLGKNVAVSGGVAFSSDKATKPDDIEAPWYIVDPIDESWKREMSIQVTCIS